MSCFLQLADQELHFETVSDLQDLEEKLTYIIQDLLNNNLDKLISVLYKIDISEQILTNVISVAPTEQISLLLAKEIIKRELLKIETRKKYKDYFNPTC